MPLTKVARPLLALPRPAKRVIGRAVDASLIALTVWIVFCLRLDEWGRLSGECLFLPMWAIAASWLIALPPFIPHRFYRVNFRCSGRQRRIGGLNQTARSKRTSGRFGHLRSLKITTTQIVGDDSLNAFIGSGGNLLSLCWPTASPCSVLH